MLQFNAQWQTIKFVLCYHDQAKSHHVHAKRLEKQTWAFDDNVVADYADSIRIHTDAKIFAPPLACNSNILWDKIIQK